MKTSTYLRLLETGWRFARTEIAAVSAFLLAALGLLVFLEVADEVGEGEAGIDQAVLESLRVGGDPSALVGPPWLHRAAEQLTGFGDTWVLIVVALVVAGFLLIQKKPGQCLLLAVSLGGGTALSELLKHLFARDRPAAAYRTVEVLNESFPSGHAMLSAVAYLTLGVLLARVLGRKRLKIYVLAVAFTLAFVVGLTRVYLGAHWLTDVVAGWSLGAAWAMVCWLAAYALARYRAARRVARTVDEG